MTITESNLLRFCDVCAAGEDVHKTVCELCQNCGGAYKALDKPGKWIHSLCASWIPEIYFLDTKKTALMTINRLDKKRFRLKCALCSGKGACIECKHGKCRTAAHPWCVLHNPCGFTKRVIKDEDNTMVWDIFCKTHASSVSEPIKPKPKSKIVQQLAAAPIPGSEIIVDEKVKEKERIAKKALLASNSLPKLSMAHSVRKASSSVPKKNQSESVTDLTIQQNQESSSSISIAVKEIKADLPSTQEVTKVLSNSPSLTGKKIRGPYKKKGSSQVKGGDDDDDDSEKKCKSVEKEKIKEKDKDTEKEKEKEKEKANEKDLAKGKQISVNKVQFVVQPKQQKEIIKSDVDANEIIEIDSDPTQLSQNLKSFSIQTLNEWPGQSEGEAMDLEHFWNVAAMQYPEDHTIEVINPTLSLIFYVL